MFQWVQRVLGARRARIESVLVVVCFVFGEVVVADAHGRVEPVRRHEDGRVDARAGDECVRGRQGHGERLCSPALRR